ncbi:uncharacterized protein LOC122516593 [Polistes fuscatus]|uniref:uncharacterized protein LOC122516593 n=1 Tax=Polistes fuscatus TaxID=30207 RepID=UPI001CAA316F|nr:uncharacterized protein LOC122516593 [Polistes fuscatus]
MEFSELYALFLMILSFLVSVTILMAKDVYDPTLKESVTKKTKKKIILFEDDIIDEKDVKEEAIFRYFNPLFEPELLEYRAMLLESYKTESMTEEERKKVEDNVDKIVELHRLNP